MRMRPTDPHGASDHEDDDLPVLPIPRPEDRSRARERHPTAIAAPQLGGGASFTAAQPGNAGPVDEPDPGTDQQDHARHDTERMIWDLAARLTQGMLANPGRNQASVKDAMGLFDQFLHEMHGYVRIASEFDLLGSESERRRNHSEYFRGTAGSPAPDAPSSASSRTPPSHPSPPPKAAPTQPRPSNAYMPIPPGARGPYAPGSMAGTTPLSPDDEDDSSAPRAAAA